MSDSKSAHNLETFKSRVLLNYARKKGSIDFFRQDVSENNFISIEIVLLYILEEAYWTFKVKRKI